MRKLINIFFQIVFMFVTVVTAFYAMREWQRNKQYYKGRFAEFKNRVKRKVKVEGESAFNTVVDLQSQIQEDSAKIIREVKSTAENIKSSDVVTDAIDLLDNLSSDTANNESKAYKELTPRQNIIYAIIKGKKAVEMKDLLMRVSGVTERTLRRDLLKLQELKLITKKGTTKAVTYVLN